MIMGEYSFKRCYEFFYMECSEDFEKILIHGVNGQIPTRHGLCYMQHNRNENDKTKDNLAFLNLAFLNLVKWIISNA